VRQGNGEKLVGTLIVNTSGNRITHLALVVTIFAISISLVRRRRENTIDMAGGPVTPTATAIGTETGIPKLRGLKAKAKMMLPILRILLGRFFIHGFIASTAWSSNLSQKGQAFSRRSIISECTALFLRDDVSLFDPSL
jgi:hypothetical protein